MAYVQALFQVSGSIHSTRVETWEAGTNKKGRDYPAGSYGEVTILADRSVLDGEVTDIPSTVSCRCDVEELAKFGKGQLVVLWVTPFVDLIVIKGQWANRVGYRIAAVEDSARVAASLS